MCLVPDADMFEAIKSGRASVVTDQIETFTEKGILLKSGKELEADIIVTATGLVMQAFGGMELSVDGQPVDPGQTLAYKGVMLSGVPNSGLGVRLHQCLVDAESRPDLQLCLPAVELHGPERRAPGHAKGAADESAAAPFVEKFHAWLH